MAKREYADRNSGRDRYVKTLHVNDNLIATK